ncbi:MAG: hypothetical protein R2712_08050 [Vicinamibacterales bacterium]
MVVFQGINALKPADLWGPGTAGIPVSTSDQDNVTLLLARANLDPAALPARFRSLVTEHMPMLVGLAGFRPYLLSVGSDAHVGWDELVPVVIVLLVVALGWLAYDLARRPSAEGVPFAAYLAVIGLESGAAYALTRDPSVYTLRYGLLALLLPIAAAALMLHARRPIGLRSVGAALVGLLAAASLVDHATVLQRSTFAPPPPRFVPLARTLEDKGVHVARAGYWRSYVVAFLTAERVKVASTELQRIREYQLLADRAGPGVVTIQETPCDTQAAFAIVGPWHLCR